MSYLCAPYLCRVHTHLLPTRGTCCCILFHVRTSSMLSTCILSKVSGVCIRVCMCVCIHVLIPNVSACSVHTSPQALSLTSKMLQYSYSTVTLQLHYSYSYTTVTVQLHYSYTTVTLQLQYSYTTVTDATQYEKLCHLTTTIFTPQQLLPIPQ